MDDNLQFSIWGISGPAPRDAALPLRSGHGSSAGHMAAGQISKFWDRWDISLHDFFLGLKQLGLGYISSCCTAFFLLKELKGLFGCYL